MPFFRFPNAICRDLLGNFLALRAAVAFLPLSLTAADPDAIRFQNAALNTASQLQLTLEAPADRFLRLEASEDLTQWTTLQTLQSAGTNVLSVPAGPQHPGRFFRAQLLEASETLTGDHLATTNGDLVIHPVNHASFVLSWNGLVIFNDPVGGATPYIDFPKPSMILVSHQHGDHFNAETLSAVRGPETRIVAPAAVYSGLSADLRAITLSMTNGASTNLLGIHIEAVPAYNSNHPKGSGNGYVLTVGGRRLYISGDTGAIPETRALKDVDVAFLSMNVPFTMSIPDAISVTRDFQPRVVYPYHYRNQGGALADLAAFQQGVGTDLDIEVRLRDWY
jgi:L-ascorbate metabolism protein UlaG (beta-lactamase superfamily)